MITRLLIDLLVTVPAWLLSTIPTVTLPSALVGTGSGTLLGGITAAAGSAASMDSWFPVGQAVAAAGFVLLTVFVGIAVKGSRIVASFLTGGGGSAA